MISFNGLGYESMTGEPNTWEPRVGNPLPYVPPKLVPQEQWKSLSKRGIDAAFLLHEVDQRAEEDRYWDGLQDLLVECEQQEAREKMLRTLQPEPLPVDEHLQAKIRRAKRREQNLLHKRSE